MRHYCILFSLMVLFASLSVTAQAQTSFPLSAQCAPPTQISRPLSNHPTARTMTVTVPVTQPTQPICNPRQTFPVGCCPAPVPVAQPRMSTTPVRVDVSVRAEGPEKTNMAPIVYRDPGFFRAIVTSAVSLAGATIAAPFRILETLVPVDCENRIPNSCRPRPPSSCSTQCPAPTPPMIGKCVPKPCFPTPVTCAPPGPSVAPLPPFRPAGGCAPFIPPKMVEDPPCEPQSLLGGLANLPSRFAQRGRFFGDMGQSH